MMKEKERNDKHEQWLKDKGYATEHRPRTPEQIEHDQAISVEKERKYQEEMPEDHMRVEFLRSWPDILELLGPHHPLTKRYIDTPKELQPILKLALRYTLDPRGMAAAEQLKKDMRDNLLKGVEQFERLITGSRTWRRYAEECASVSENIPSINTSRAGEVDAALEEFMRDPPKEEDETA